MTERLQRASAEPVSDGPVARRSSREVARRIPGDGARRASTTTPRGVADDGLAEVVIARFASPRRAAPSPQAPGGSRIRRRDAVPVATSTGLLPSSEVGFADGPLTDARDRTGERREVVRRIHEADFTADPEGFMAANTITPDFEVGILTSFTQKYGAPSAELRALLVAVVHDLPTLKKVWFRLTFDAAKSKDRAVYHLTPAIDKLLAQREPEAASLVALAEALAAAGTVMAVEPESSYISAGYIPYYAGTDPTEMIGHTTVKGRKGAEDLWNPDFVFTAAMNGCALAITDVTDETFEAWHFQSPSSYMSAVVEFMTTHPPTDWYGFAEYAPQKSKGTFAATNVLARGAQGWRILSQLNADASGDYVSIQPINEQRLLHHPPSRLYQDMFLGFPQLILDEMAHAYPTFLNRHAKQVSELKRVAPFFHGYMAHLNSAVTGLRAVDNPRDLGALSARLLQERSALEPEYARVEKSRLEHLDVYGSFVGHGTRLASKELKAEFDPANYEHRQVLSKIMSSGDLSGADRYNAFASDLDLLLNKYRNKDQWIRRMGEMAAAMAL